MKQLVYLLFITFLFISCDQKSIDGTLLTGTVDNPAGEQVTLQKYSIDGLSNIDSTQLDENNEFEMVIEAKEPGFYRLNFSDRKMVNLVLDNNPEKVTVTVDAGQPRGAYDVTGSTGTNWIMKMDSIYLKKQSDAKMLNNEAMQARSAGDAELFEEIKEQFFMLSSRHDNNMKELIWKAAPSLAGIYGTNYINVENSVSFMDSLALVYQEEIPEHELVVDFVSKVDRLKKLAVGAEAPEISLPNPEGETVTLSSLKGNYVLIDFWAAWCKPCRVENPNVVKLYNKYKDENFEILGVSLDRKREDWIQAIEDDQLSWKHVSDLKYFRSEAAQDYRINAIPATFLIDPEGKIVAKGLRGESLKQKLEELFGA
mgnify:CR=1 FL=1